MKKAILFLFVCFPGFHEYAEAQFSKYIIRLKDKNGSPFSIANPLQYLSAKSLERRSRQNISVDETDLPVNPAYIDSIRLAGDVTVLNKSKWLNQVCIQTTDADALVRINNFSFVSGSQAMMRPQRSVTVTGRFKEKVYAGTYRWQLQSDVRSYDYGAGYSQIHIHEGDYLHNRGFNGEGMLIAIMDAGFYHYQTITAFDSVRNNHQIGETYDFVNNEISVDEDNIHGMYCFSIMAANWPGQLVGSCPGAKFFLYRTEDAGSEYPVEEQNWIAAAERADSIGVDVFSTSLGYSTFDNSAFSHTYADLDGNTTDIAKASDLAARKGIISVVAAGNEGGSSWHFISTPADADSAVTVGAVNSSGTVAAFSSYGPSADGQIKPTVASVGVGTAIANTNDQPAFGDGTSFATPNLAGLITCLWQAFREFSNMEIISAVIKSSSSYNTPDNRIGYGIPDFHKAFDDLTRQRALKNNPQSGNEWIKILPNPFAGSFNILLDPPKEGTATLQLYDAGGKLYQTQRAHMQAGQPQVISFDKLQPLAGGIYILKYSDGVTEKSIQVLAH